MTHAQMGAFLAATSAVIGYCLAGVALHYGAPGSFPVVGALITGVFATVGWYGFTKHPSLIYGAFVAVLALALAVSVARIV